MYHHVRIRKLDYLVPPDMLRFWVRKGGNVVSEVADEVAARARTKPAHGKILLVLDWNDDVSEQAVEVEAPAPMPKRKRSKA